MSSTDANANSPVVLITGCSTGFGRSLALNALSRGLRVIATARRLSTLDDLRDKGAKVFTLDVNAKREALNEFATKEAIAAFGQVDILINNAGYLLAGAIEEDTEEEIRAQFDTNFFAVINLTCSLLPHFRQRRTGAIVNISSQGAYLAIPGCGIYSATKAALDCITEVWSKELAPFNIRAVSLGLGAFRTAVATSSNTIKPQRGEIEGYDSAHDFLRIFQERAGQELGDPDKAAKKIFDLLLSPSPPPPPPPPLPLRFAIEYTRILKERLKDIEEWKEFPVGVNAEGPVFEGSGGKF
ncbi:putative short-chain oxidoreductase [Dendrothele bispora CBS 962.96]|uniref:Putative short-chain oxidoreductase n=1 Tax=Dendrothele bispora (strain CBS 962.96) TaxID=1314807 RepID=A0A4S8MHB8_DENBC|nr:putative short-chain oxidoreductase [Dendrothele bispora CBS 962.96]